MLRLQRLDESGQLNLGDLYINKEHISCVFIGHVGNLRFTHIQLSNGSIYLVPYSLGEVLDMLDDDT